ncbi:MAG: BrnT family toxin [Cytophagales bacterium]
MKNELLFDWDDANIGKILLTYPKRGIELEEIESVFEDQNIYIQQDRIGKFGEFEYHCIGKSVKDRLLFIVFTLRNGKIRPFSARIANSKSERPLYYES